MIVGDKKNKMKQTIRNFLIFNKNIVIIIIIAISLVFVGIGGIVAFTFIKNLPKKTDTYQTLEWDGNKIAKIEEGEYIPTEESTEEDIYIYDGYDRDKEQTKIVDKFVDETDEEFYEEDTKEEFPETNKDLYIESDNEYEPVFNISVIYDNYNISPYTGDKPYTTVNDNNPFFSSNDIEYVLNKGSFEYYSPLDMYGRCNTTIANIGTDIMPTEERGKIGMVKPSGWNQKKYDFIDGKFLYNRCHLIGYQLAGENANECNLITGTRYLNVEGMLPFENEIAEYVRDTSNHVLYRVTPLYKDNEPLSRGVLMEAYSVEDEGESIKFNVFCYNVQPGVIIDYSDGSSKLEGE